MGQLQLGNGAGKAHPMEYILRFGIPAIVIYAGIKVFNAFAPTLIKFFENIWYLTLIGAPVVLALLYVISNPMVVWMGWKTICRKITAFFIKLDPLSYMDRYVELLRTKRGNLDRQRKVLLGKYITLDRWVKDKKDTIEHNLKLGKAAVEQKQNSAASKYGTMVATDESSIRSLMPILLRMKKSLEFMDTLSENWGTSIETLQYQVDNKRREFEMIKETYKGLKNAEDFINSDSEAAQLFTMSLKALEEDVTQKIAYIEQFEKDSKGAMDGMKVEKQATQDEGLSKLEQYMKDGKLMLPDYNSFIAPAINTNNIETIAWQQVTDGSKPNAKEAKFNL